MKLLSSLRSAPLALLLLGSVAAAQAQPGEPETAGDGLPIFSRSDLVLDQYPVQHVNPAELFQIAHQLAGRSYHVKDNHNASISGMRLLGSKIVLYDTQVQVQRARELLARLDVPRQLGSPSRKTQEYRPRFVSLQTAENAIENLVRVERMAERNLLILADEPENIERALELLKRIDVPEKQVLLTCQLIEVGETPEGPPLPKELVENLQRLLPGSQFNQTGLAMLKTSVGGENQISLRVTSESQDYRLAFTAVAFDESTASLTVAECRVMQLYGAENERELFRTNTVLRGGEYTVLAATGITPMLLVLRVTPQN